MAWLIGSASFLMSLYSILMLHPFENEIVNGVCSILLAVTSSILLFIAEDKEENLKSRIKKLEDKFDNKEENK